MKSDLVGESSPRSLWFGPLFVVIVDDPEQIQKVLSSKSCVDKPFMFKKLGPPDGLTFSNGSLWRKHRKIIIQAFNLQNLKSFQQTFNINAKLMIEKLKDHLDGNEFDIYKILSATTCNNLLSNLCGNKRNFLNDDTDEILDFLNG